MRKGRIRFALFSAALAAISFMYASCENRNNAGSQVSEEASVPVFAVNTTTAVRGQIRDYIALSGDIVASSVVDAYSEVAGKVISLSVAVGDRVDRDEPLAEVDPSRPGMVFNIGVVKAPIAGTVVALPAQIGMTISQAVPIARISGNNALEIRLYIAERFISQIALNLPCEISLDAYPGEVFRGRVSELSPVVDPASRTMEIRVRVDNAGTRLKAGMFAKVRIITQRKENIVKIPATAMVQRFGESLVFTLEQDSEDPAILVARARPVVPGILIDGVLEVQQGLGPDEEIVIRGQTLLEDGVRVNVVDRVAPLSAAE
ncbi:MAG: efflux RND transporter periplasmic adaptor subunit [Treponema sp.]|jgi:multidrug efflux pump subunit AcrA (membrane-fusion protein)|nr:efflux RND transporter periplasmic adaptor subunit [Treponema sp.]